MKIWRDIIPHDVWTQVVQPHLSLKAIRGSDLFKRAKDEELGSKYTRRELLEILGCHIRIYHEVDKTSYDRIDRRIGHLKELSHQAKLYLDNFVDKGIDPSQRMQKRSVKGYFRASDSTKESLERNVLTLQRRSLRKATYLNGIKALYAKPNNYTSPQDFVDFLKNPNKGDHGNLLDVNPNVRMEVLDPAHRSFEFDHAVDLTSAQDLTNLEYWHPSTGEIGNALARWYNEVFTQNKHSLPFFLWLENDSVCLRDNKAANFDMVDRSVGYVGKNVEPQDISMLKVLYCHHTGELRMWKDQRILQSELADTKDYTANNSKGPTDGQGGAGVAAFAWTQNGDIVIGQHAEHKFHHTSFAAGGLVQCAGMIKIKQGKVEWVSNNSGHYKPKKENLLRFLEFLRNKGITDDTKTMVDCFGLQTRFLDKLSVFRTKMSNNELN